MTENEFENSRKDRGVYRILLANGKIAEIIFSTLLSLIKLLDPKYIEVTGIFTPRGGISIYPYANYGRPGTKYEKMAEFRLLHHDLHA